MKIVMQHNLVGCSEEQQIHNEKVILDFDSIKDLRTLLENVDTLYHFEGKRGINSTLSNSH
jgi:hypothetical protein